MKPETAMAYKMSLSEKLFWRGWGLKVNTKVRKAEKQLETEGHGFGSAAFNNKRRAIYKAEARALLQADALNTSNFVVYLNNVWVHGLTLKPTDPKPKRAKNRGER